MGILYNTVIEYNVLNVVLLMVVLVGFIDNVIHAFTKTKELREQGETPLVGRLVTSIIVAVVAELITVFVVVYIFATVAPQPNLWIVALVFLIGYGLRNLSAYLSVWGMWSIFRRKEQKKMTGTLQEEMQREREGGE